MAEPVQNVRKKSYWKVKAAGYGAGALAVAVLIAIFVPIVPIASEEEYVVMQTRTVSYQEPVEKQKELFLQEDYTIQPNSSFTVTRQVDAGHEVEFKISASDTINTYIRTSKGNTLNSREDVSSATYRFTAPIDDNYTFTVFNNHNGVLGLGSKTVGLYSASATERWQEQVTKERIVTEPVTEGRKVTKNVTVLEMITGSIRVPNFG